MESSPIVLLSYNLFFNEMPYIPQEVFIYLFT